MVKPPLRTKSIGTKVSEEEYAQLEAVARTRGLTQLMVVVVNHVPGFSYDGMGNVTLDSLLNTNSYDTEDRPITAAGVQTTFDAFGRAFEQNRSGAYAQIVYSPSGAKFGGWPEQSPVGWGFCFSDHAAVLAWSLFVVTGFRSNTMGTMINDRSGGHT